MKCPKCGKEYTKAGWYYNHLVSKHPKYAALKLAISEWYIDRIREYHMRAVVVK